MNGMWPLLHVWDNTVTFLPSVNACWMKWKAIFELSVTFWQQRYIVEVTPILSSLPPSWLLKSVAGGRQQTARVWLTFTHYSCLPSFRGSSTLWSFVEYFSRRSGLTKVVFLLKKMALRQDSDKEPRIELFIKVSYLTLVLVGHIMLLQVKNHIQIQIILNINMIWCKMIYECKIISIIYLKNLIWK